MSAKPVIVIGSGGHAKVCIDLLKCLNRTVIGIVSLDQQIKSVLGVPVMGTDACIRDYAAEEIELVNGIGFLPRRDARQVIHEKFKKRGYIFSQLVHPSAVVSTYAQLSEGCQIMAGCIIQAEAQVGESCIINTRTSIDHDCKVSAHCHLAPSVTLCGGVEVGPNTFIGVGSVVSNGVSIGADVTVAAGKNVIKSIPDNGILVKEKQDVVNYAEQ